MCVIILEGIGAPLYLYWIYLYIYSFQAVVQPLFPSFGRYGIASFMSQPSYCLVRYILCLNLYRGNLIQVSSTINHSEITAIFG